MSDLDDRIGLIQIKPKRARHALHRKARNRGKRSAMLRNGNGPSLLDVYQRESRLVGI
jgi:hypothetical protein